MEKGDKFVYSFSITEELYSGFIHLFGDKNPLHVNKEFAKSKGFADEVVHGNILGGFISYFIGECLPIKNVILQSQEIKYRKPIYKNQELLLKAEVEEVYKSVNAIEFRFSFEEKSNAEIVAKGKIQIGII